MRHDDDIIYECIFLIDMGILLWAKIFFLFSIPVRLYRGPYPSFYLFLFFDHSVSMTLYLTLSLTLEFSRLLWFPFYLSRSFCISVSPSLCIRFSKSVSLSLSLSFHLSIASNWFHVKSCQFQLTPRYLFQMLMSETHLCNQMAPCHGMFIFLLTDNNTEKFRVVKSLVKNTKQ